MWISMVVLQSRQWENYPASVAKRIRRATPSGQNSAGIRRSCSSMLPRKYRQLLEISSGLRWAVVLYLLMGTATRLDFSSSDFIQVVRFCLPRKAEEMLITDLVLTVGAAKRMEGASLLEASSYYEDGAESNRQCEVANLADLVTALDLRKMGIAVNLYEMGIVFGEGAQITIMLDACWLLCATRMARRGSSVFSLIMFPVYVLAWISACFQVTFWQHYCGEEGDVCNLVLTSLVNSTMAWTAERNSRARFLAARHAAARTVGRFAKPRWMIAAALAVFLVGGALASWTRSGTQSSTHTDDEVSFLEQAEVLKKVVLYQKVRLLSNLTEEELQRHKIDVVSLPPTGPLFVQQKETRLIARNLGYKTSYSHQDNTITITQETSKDVFVRVSMCIADVTLAALKMMSALLSLEASIHVCNLHTPESEDAKWEKVWSGNRRLRDIVPKTRRLAFNVPQSSVKGQSVQEAKMSCAAQINGIISSFLAVSQYVSDTITSCPAPNDIPKGSNYPARCSMSISVLTSGATKSASALSDIAVQCADPTNGDIPYSREIDPDRAPQVLAACLNNIGQAIDYIVKTAYELNALATEPGGDIFVWCCQRLWENHFGSYGMFIPPCSDCHRNVTFVYINTSRRQRIDAIASTLMPPMVVEAQAVRLRCKSTLVDMGDCCEIHHEEPKPRAPKPKEDTPKPKEVKKEKTDQSRIRITALTMLESVGAGDWTKAPEVTLMLELFSGDREVCRSAATAAERIACQEKGLDVLTERGAIQQLLQVWCAHRNDTSLAVHVHNIVARFWERVSCDNQWICLPAQQAAGKALLTSGQNEWLAEAHKAAVKLHEKGFTTAAMEMYRQCIEQFNKDVGEDHQCTLQAKNNFAVLLEECQQFQEAEKMHIEVCKQFETKFGAEHGDVTSSKFNLAALRAKMGNLEESETMYKQVLEVRERTLGPQHSNTLRAKANLADEGGAVSPHPLRLFRGGM
ncbi:Kinesin light chain 2 [Symbiodinium microadriaticum]|uniref:Kinesin light chain 2 n=1 Tax=Symbiodinium microadriaticum TaxID=2951 RepID=A0A1Q9DLJ6_SYMMI|nr:Kinesin light chain 2 [Symbiodinium microadriaticum]